MIDCERLDNPLGLMESWAKENRAPLNMTFELTPFCNFSCVMCYVHLTPEKAEKQGRILSADEWLGIARQAKEMGTLYINLTGGEPFLHPEFWEIYSELNKMGFLITVLSNGSMIDETVMDKFREYGMPYRMKLTIYGASNETYMRTCKSPDGFTRISKAIDLLKESGVPLQLTSTVVRENAADLQAMYDFAGERGIPMQHTITVVKSSRDSVNTVEKSRFDIGCYAHELTLEKLEQNMLPDLESPFAWCASYGTSLWITWHGHLQMCCFMNIPFVNYSGDLREDFDELLDRINELRSPAECSACEWRIFCQRCPGILCSESGSPEKTDEDLCNLAKQMYELYIRLKKEN